MSQSLEVLGEILDVVDNDRVFVNQSPYGEPQLGRRGLYRALGGTEIPDGQLAMLWVLNLSDGTHSLMDIAERAGMPFSTIVATADILREHRLLTELTD
jgi:aminopeptidase-like protein